MKRLLTTLLTLTALVSPVAAKAEITVNPDIAPLYLLTGETYQATREIARSNPQGRGGSYQTEHMDCYHNALDVLATICTTFDGQIRVIQLLEGNVVRFVVLAKTAEGTLSGVLTTVGAAGDRHFATGDDARLIVNPLGDLLEF